MCMSMCKVVPTQYLAEVSVLQLRVELGQSPALLFGPDDEGVQGSPHSGGFPLWAGAAELGFGGLRARGELLQFGLFTALLQLHHFDTRQHHGLYHTERR